MQRTARAPARRRSEGPPRALVVEDSDVDQRVLVRLLTDLGCEATVATDGWGGVDAACRGDYDFVFMDVEMPRLDGRSATQRIHETLGPRSPFIVAVTSHRGPAERQACADAGMDYFLEKPVRRRALGPLLADGAP